MFDWLMYNLFVVYLLLGVIAIGLLVAFWLTRKRAWLFAAGGVLVLILIVFLLRLFVPTDYARIMDSIQAMRSGVQKHDTEAVMKHIAQDFSFGSFDRKAFRARVDHAFQNRFVDDVNFWEFDEVKIDRPNKTATLAFKAKPHPQSSGEGLEHYLVRATFVLEPDDQWRLKTFRLFNPIVDTDKPLTVSLP
jgi:hypothetical protein